MPSRLGQLARASSRDGMPPGEDSSTKVRSDDLFPIDQKEVATFLLDRGHTLSDSVAGMVNSLNYLALFAGGGHLPEALPDRPLSRAQESVLEHLCDAVKHLEDSGQVVTSFEEAAKPLAAAKFGYDGEPIMVMEDIEADLVIQAWPSVGQAAVQDAVDFVPEPLKARLLDPRSCLLPLHEWPERPPVAKVRATDEEWEKVVTAAYARGLMAAVDPKDVFTDGQGRPVVSGAGSVVKYKKVGSETKRVQRFISNFVPINSYQARLEGDDHLLPYLGQLTLLQQGANEVWALDSEDFTSCFNLFRLPSEWLRYMCFGKLVSARAFGGPADKQVFASMCVLPMGWISSVAVIQSIVRTLVFKEAEVPVESEVAKTKPVPELTDLSVIYLDSFDQLRELDRECHKALEEQPSERHEKFLKVCKEKGLPLNEAKRLIAATKGTLQGGELDGEKGRYGLSPDKMAGILSLGGALLGSFEWTEWMLRHFVGKATFGMCFRRPLFSVLQVLFEEIQERTDSQSSSRPLLSSMDEVVMVLTLVPLMMTNLKAQVDDEISVSDASPCGGGAAAATKFRGPPLTVSHSPDTCFECGGEVQDGWRYPCPADCGAGFCSLACVFRHRDIDRASSGECPRRTWRPPRFGERFAGERAPLSHAVSLAGHIEVQEPYDLHFGNDMFTEQGRQELARLMDDEHLFCEHWAPECKLFSRARGRVIRLADGTTVAGPQPVRDARHVMGFPWLSNDMKSRVRKSNNMVLKSLKRGLQKDRPNKYWTLEHPYGSWIWEFTLAKEMDAKEEFSHSVGSSCCFGGRREKWFSFFGDLPNLRQYLQVDCPGHEGLLGYEVTRGADGALVYPTEEEAEYPWQLCTSYTAALREQVDEEQVFERMALAERERHFQQELGMTTARLAESPVCEAVAALLAREEALLTPGQEKAHLCSLLRHATYRGTDVRFWATLDVEDSPEVHELPYLAMQWEWKTILAFPWKDDGHINELEMQAVAVYLKRRARYAGLHPRTLRAYRQALDRFLKYISKRNLSVRTPRRLDIQLADFIDMAYQEGEPIAYAGHLLSAVKRFHPELRLELPRSSQLFRNWQRCHIPARALPASWDLVQAIMGLAFFYDEPEFAILIALGFNCLLRTTEMLHITHSHVVFHPKNKALSLILPGSKTSQGNPQVLLVTDDRLVQLVRRFVHPGRQTLLWAHGPHQFRQAFGSFLLQLGFTASSYTPYCLRRGGATWHFQASLSLDSTVTRGFSSHKYLPELARKVQARSAV
eukprot:s206_g15.t1